MSALPTSRPAFDTQEPQFFVQIPDPAIEDPNLTDFQVRLLLWLARWLRLHPGRFPSINEAATALRKSRSTISAAYRALGEAGYIALEKTAPGRRRFAGMAFRLRTPQPKATKSPTPDPQIVLPLRDPDECERVQKTGPVQFQEIGPVSPAPIEERAPIPISEERKDRQTDSAGEPAEESVSRSDESLQGELPMQLPDPILGSQPEEDPDALENDLIDDLVNRAADLFGSMTRETILRTAKEHTLDFVEAAIEMAERKNPAPTSWRYVLAILENWKTEGATVRKVDKAKAKAVSRIFDPDAGLKQNYNPGLGSADCKPTTPEAAALLRSFIRRPRPAPASAEEEGDA